MKTESPVVVEQINENSLPILNLDKINANSLPELQGWKEKQETLLSENPFIKITNNTSYSEGKKRRTALLKGRTIIQGQDKLIASKLKEFRAKVSIASHELIKITLEAEEKQQNEVKKYEDKKELDRIEKVRLDDLRRKEIQEKIDIIFDDWRMKINDFTFETIKSVSILEELSDIDAECFEEFAADFNEKTRVLTQLFSEKKSSLQVKENQRLETLKLAAERKKFEKEQEAAKEKAVLQERELSEQQALIDAENQKKQDALDQREREMDADKERIAKIETERVKREELIASKKIEKENAVKKIKEEKSELKRVNDLKPDKLKLQKYITELSFSEEDLKLKNKQSIEFLKSLDEELGLFKTNMILSINLI